MNWSVLPMWLRWAGAIFCANATAWAALNGDWFWAFLFAAGCHMWVEEVFCTPRREDKER